MKARERLDGARRIFLDTAPVIYFIESNPRYHAVVKSVFQRLDSGGLLAVTSPVTLAECLVHPLRHRDRGLADTFVEMLVRGPGTTLLPIGAECGKRAAELRAEYGLTLTDSFQLAAALLSDCDVFLTNDVSLRKVTELAVVVLDELLQEQV